MHDLREAMRREASTIAPHPDALDTVVRAADTARRRTRARVRTLALAIGGLAMVATAVGLGGLVGDRKVTPNDSSEWAGLWPDASRADAVDAQAELAAGDPSMQWRKDGAEVVERFGLESLGWDKVVALHEGFETRGGFVEMSVFSEPDFTGPATVGITPCLLEERSGRSCEAALVTLTRFSVAPDIWEVTDVQRIELPQVPSLGRDEALQVAREFLERRVVGSGAEDLLSSSALEAFDPGPNQELDLYAGYVSFDVEFAYRTHPGLVQLFAHLIDSSGKKSTEQLAVGFSRAGDVLVVGATGGDEGP
jgi:hypothetical protein